MRTVFSRPLFTALPLLFLAASVTVPIHNTLLAEQKKIILNHADTIEGSEEGEGYQSVIGNVEFQDGTLTLRCDRATNYEGEHKIVLTGNISISDPAFAIYGDSAVYFTDRQTGEIKGNVRGRMLDNSLFGKSRRAVVNKAKSEVWLYDDAIAWHQQQQISGESVLLHFTESGSRKKQEIDEIEVHNNAFFASADTLSRSPVVYDQFSGKKMIIRLKEGKKIAGITLNGQAESLYHLYNEKRQPSGINYSSGDMIRMFFADGILGSVKVSGNVEGKQFPESFRGNPKINLSKFAWRERENPFRTQKSLP